MANPSDTHEITVTTEHQEPPSPFTADTQMVMLTWVTFLLLLVVLYKFAWKPLLTILDNREKMIRGAVEDADRVKQELQTIQQKQHQLIQEAETKAKDIIQQSRKAAIDAAHIIHDKAKEESAILLENALREIKEETNKAQAHLKEASAKMAIDLAGKLIQENLNDDKNRQLINDLILKSSI